MVFSQAALERCARSHFSCYINCMSHFSLKPSLTPGAVVTTGKPGLWHLEIPAGLEGRYRLAQIDDYKDLRRSQFRWQPPFHLSLKARVSAQNIPGTWGFGLWNDPFSFSLGLGGGTRRFPALPDTAWFFYAAPPNYLSFRDDLPGQGFLAATFRSAPVPAPLLAAGGLALPLLLVPALARLLRRSVRALVRQSTALVEVDVTAWHTYSLDWTDTVRLFMDGQVLLDTLIVPRGPLGLVIWIDNQYAAFPPMGRLQYGFSANPEPAWMEVEIF